MSRISAFRLPALTLIALLAVGCGTSAADPLEATPVETSQVSIRDNEFEPAAVEVPVGTEVTWTWEGDSDHNVVADDFSSDVQSEGTYARTFDEPGTYAYNCTLHAGMEGAVIVTDGAGSSETG